MNILFLDSKNLRRGPAALRIFSGVPGVDALSAGVDIDACGFVSRDLLRKAHVIFAMEQRHFDAMVLRFGEAMRHELTQKTVILGIDAHVANHETALIDALITRVCESMPGMARASDLRRRHGACLLDDAA